MSFLVFLENPTPVQETGQGKVPRVGISLPFLFLRNARKIHESLIIGREVRLDTPLFPGLPLGRRVLRFLVRGDRPEFCRNRTSQPGVGEIVG